MSDDRLSEEHVGKYIVTVANDKLYVVKILSLSPVNSNIYEVKYKIITGSRQGKLCRGNIAVVNGIFVHNTRKEAIYALKKAKKGSGSVI
jgi:hypothetical protein